MTFHCEHRPLQAYSDALANAGFLIERIREVGDPSPDDKWHRIRGEAASTASAGRRSRNTVSLESARTTAMCRCRAAVQARSQIPAPVRITVRVWEPVGSVQVSR